MRRTLSVLVPITLAILAVTGCGPHPGVAAIRSSGTFVPTAGVSVAGRNEDARAARVRRTRFTATGPTPTILPPVCDADQHCVYPGTQTLQVTGGWSGQLMQGSGAVTLTTGSRFTSAALNLFVGSVKGCGTGTAVVRLFEVGTLAPPTGTGRWEVVPGFGTGELASLTGRGTGRGGIESGVRTSTQTGRITCDRT